MIDFKVINDIQQPLDSTLVAGGPFLHIATVQRRSVIYTAFLDQPTNTTYIEILDPHYPGWFKKIEDESEWWDVYMFLKDRGYFEIGRERKVASLNKK